ncbi:hypothetical protein NM2002030_2149 [Neisseria meningitidis 2002030]|nr:hypothetical protein NM2002030_2149 [Neisseria meningitidis 2002030]
MAGSRFFIAGIFNPIPFSRVKFYFFTAPNRTCGLCYGKGSLGCCSYIRMGISPLSGGINAVFYRKSTVL